MSTGPRIRASRRNGLKSRGPRSAAGKRITSRNALRHGLAAVTCRRAMPAGEVARLTKALCGADEHPALVAAAQVVAVDHLVLCAIREQQIEAVERLRTPGSAPFSKGNNALELGRARFMKAVIAGWEIEKEVPKLLEKYKNHQGKLEPAELEPDPGELIPHVLWSLLDEEPEPDQRAIELARKQVECDERNDWESFVAAVPDLVRLDRYERRAWSRYKRGIRAFMNTKLMIDLGRLPRGEGTSDGTAPTSVSAKCIGCA